MPPLDSKDRRRCEELACKPGSAFEMAYRFLDGVEAARAVALEAAFRSISDIPYRVNDPGVAMAKISWWAQELNAATESGSQHPVVRALLAIGQPGASGVPAWMGYVRAVSANIERGSISTVGELERQLRATRGFELLTQAGVNNECAEARHLGSLSVASGLLELGASLARAEADGFPLDLQAKFAVTPKDPDAGQLIKAAVHLAEQGLHQLDIFAEGWRETGALPGGRFLAIYGAIEGRRLQDMKRNPRRVLGRGFPRASVREVLAAWQRARNWPPAGSG